MTTRTAQSKAFRLTWVTSDGDLDVSVSAVVVPGVLREPATVVVESVVLMDSPDEPLDFGSYSRAERSGLYLAVLAADGWCRVCHGSRTGWVRVGPVRTRRRLFGGYEDASDYEEDACIECGGKGRAP